MYVCVCVSNRELVRAPTPAAMDVRLLQPYLWTPRTGHFVHCRDSQMKRSVDMTAQSIRVGQSPVYAIVIMSVRPSVCLSVCRTRIQCLKTGRGLFRLYDMCTTAI